MKLFRYIAAVILIAGYSYPQDCEALITLTSDVENTEYHLDGRKIGEGKNLTVQSDTGVYVLTAREAGNIWDPLTFIDTVSITDCGNYSFKYVFTSVVYLRSVPSDAYVFRNDSLIGNTPLGINGDPGSLRLSKPGYKDYTVSGDKLLNAVNLEESVVKNGKSFYERDLFKYLIGGLLVLGSTTAYLKLEADDRYDLYQRTGDDKYLKETRRFDLFSGITFGALQINFGLLLYYFLIE